MTTTNCSVHVTVFFFCCLFFFVRGSLYKVHFTVCWLEKQNAAVQGSFPIDQDVNARLIYRRMIGVCYESWLDTVRLLFVGSHKKGGVIIKLLQQKKPKKKPTTLLLQIRQETIQKSWKMHAKLVFYHSVLSDCLWFISNVATAHSVLRLNAAYLNNITKNCVKAWQCPAMVDGNNITIYFQAALIFWNLLKAL